MSQNGYSSDGDSPKIKPSLCTNTPCETLAPSPAPAPALALAPVTVPATETAKNHETNRSFDVRSFVFYDFGGRRCRRGGGPVLETSQAKAPAAAVVAAKIERKIRTP